MPSCAPAAGGSFGSIMTALAVVGAVAVVALVWSERVGSAVRLVAKPLASVCFVGVGLVAGAADTVYGRWVLVALVLSAIGDVALLGRSSATFLVGLGSFLLGHVAYCVAFVARGADLRAILISALVMAVSASSRTLVRQVLGEPSNSVTPSSAVRACISCAIADACLL